MEIKNTRNATHKNAKKNPHKKPKVRIYKLQKHVLLMSSKTEIL